MEKILVSKSTEFLVNLSIEKKKHLWSMILKNKNLANRDNFELMMKNCGEKLNFHSFFPQLLHRQNMRVNTYWNQDNQMKMVS